MSETGSEDVREELDEPFDEARGWDGETSEPEDGELEPEPNPARRRGHGEELDELEDAFDDDTGWDGETSAGEDGASSHPRHMRHAHEG